MSEVNKELLERISKLEEQVKQLTKTNEMFGRSYSSIGNSNSDFIIKTRGQVKIQYGNKFIDVIKNGKLNTDFKFIYKQNEVGTKDGIYVIENEQTCQIILSVNGQQIVLNEGDNTYVSFHEEQSLDQQQQRTALTNIGFFYKDLKSVTEKSLQNGIVYIESLNKLYIIKNGSISEYSFEIPDVINKQFVVQKVDEKTGAILIKGKGLSNSLAFDSMFIYNDLDKLKIDFYLPLIFAKNGKDVITIDDENTTFNSDIKCYNISSINYSENSGFSIYSNNFETCFDIDNINVRNSIKLKDSEIQTLTLRQLYLAAGANYNSSTGYYELNGVNDIDEEEMSGIYVESLNIRVAANSYAGYPYRTTLKLHAAGQNDNLSNVFSSKYLISLGKTAPNYIAETPSLYGAFNASNNIRIVSDKAFYSVNAYGSAPFTNAKELVQVLLRSNKNGFSIKDSNRISYYSLNYLSTNASGTAFTVTLPEAQANILYLINRDYVGDGIDDIEGDTLDAIGEIIATLPWEAKLKIVYPNPIWNEDNGGSILWDSEQNGGCGVPCEYYSYLNADMATIEGGFTDARPSLIKHATGADGSQIYANWVEYVNKSLAYDLRVANTKVAQFTTATNLNFATSIQDWINLAVKFKEKNITIAGHTIT